MHGARTIISERGFYDASYIGTAAKRPHNSCAARPDDGCSSCFSHIRHNRRCPDSAFAAAFENAKIKMITTTKVISLRIRLADRAISLRGRSSSSRPLIGRGLRLEIASCFDDRARNRESAKSGVLSWKLETFSDPTANGRIPGMLPIKENRQRQT